MRLCQTVPELSASPLYFRHRFVATVIAAAFAFTMASVCFAEQSVSEWIRQVHGANILLDTGDLNAADVIYEQALTQARQAGDDLRIAIVLENIGRLLYLRGHTLEAERAYAGVIDALTRVTSLDDRLLVRTSVRLSGIYLHSGRDSKAEALVRTTLAEHPAAAVADRASLMVSLGIILAHKQRIAEAEQLFSDTAKLAQMSSDPALQEVGAIAIANVAAIQIHGGGQAEAIALYQQAFAILAALPNPSPITLATTLAQYAGSLRGMRERDTEESLYRKAIAIARARLGPNHPLLGEMLQEYAQVLRDHDRKTEARSLEKEAQQIQNESARENLTGHTVAVGALRSKK